MINWDTLECVQNVLITLANLRKPICDIVFCVISVLTFNFCVLSFLFCVQCCTF